MGTDRRCWFSDWYNINTIALSSEGYRSFLPKGVTMCKTPDHRPLDELDFGEAELDALEKKNFERRKKPFIAAIRRRELRLRVRWWQFWK